MAKLITKLIILFTIITLSSASLTEEKKQDDDIDDITTIPDFEAYMKRSRNICLGNDVSTCPIPDRSVCLGGYCYKKCKTSNGCAEKFMCSYENLCKPQGCIPCIKGPTYPTTAAPDAQDDELDMGVSGITTVDEWNEYMANNRRTCPSGDVNECPNPNGRICLAGKCFKKCVTKDDCGNDEYVCNFEGLCKPKSCMPCRRATYYPTPQPPSDMEEDEVSYITTEDEWDEYMANNRRTCPGGDVNECPNPNGRICLAGKCFKKCVTKDDCGNDEYVCNFEGLCKPKSCMPCRRATYYPTPQPPSDMEEDEVADITTESEWDEYMANNRRTCPGGDVNECPNPDGRICLAGKCFKKCVTKDDCGNDEYVCNFEGLCKPKSCMPCRRATYYPTPQPPSDDIMAVIDGVEMNEKEKIFSTSMMVKMTSLVGMIIFIFWICGGCMLWKKGDVMNKKIVYESSTKYGATSTSV